MSHPPAPVRVAVIGGGQAGLAAGYYLRRAGLEPHRDYVILDANPEPGGAWQHGWTSLRLFSPSEYSSLPGWPMPAWTEGFPPVDHVVRYLTRYEQRYDLPVHHGVRVTSVRRESPDGQGFLVDASAGGWRADAVISGTGTWDRPFWPSYPGCPDLPGQAAAHRAVPVAGSVPGSAGGCRWWREFRRPTAGRGLHGRGHDLGDAAAAAVPAGRCRRPGAVRRGQRPQRRTGRRPRRRAGSPRWATS